MPRHGEECADSILIRSTYSGAGMASTCTSLATLDPLHTHVFPHESASGSKALMGYARALPGDVIRSNHPRCSVQCSIASRAEALSARTSLYLARGDPAMNIYEELMTSACAIIVTGFRMTARCSEHSSAFIRSQISHITYFSLVEAV